MTQFERTQQRLLKDIDNLRTRVASLTAPTHAGPATRTRGARGANQTARRSGARGARKARGGQRRRTAANATPV